MRLRRFLKSHLPIVCGLFAMTGCGEQLIACTSHLQCPANTSCVDGYCKRAPFSDVAVSNGDIVEAGDTKVVECSAKPGGPQARAAVSGGVVSGEIVALGGETGQTGRCGAKIETVTDHWVHTRCDGWHAREGNDSPPARVGAATAVDQISGKLYVTGGRQRSIASSSWLPKRDVRVYERSTQKWTMLSPAGGKAVSHGALTVERKRSRLWLIGGDTSLQDGKIAATSMVMIFSLKTKLWAASTAKGAPPARSRHQIAMSDDEGHLYLHGGLLKSGALDGQLWRLDVKKNLWELVSTPGERPTARAGAAMHAVAGQRRIVLFGGADATQIGFRNDVWQLDTDKLRWERLSDGDLGIDKKYGGKLELGDGVNCNSGEAGGGLPASFMTIAYGSPQRRAYPVSGWDISRAALVIFGGRGECGVLADAWMFNPTGAVWTLIDDTSTGRTCPRKNPAKKAEESDCEFLCTP